MSIALLAWLWDNAPQRGTEKLLLLTMADAAGTGCLYRTNVAQLSHRINESESDVRLLLVKLEADGAIAGIGPRLPGGITAQYEISNSMPAEEFVSPRSEYQKAVIPHALRLEVFNRDNNRCRRCGTDSNLTVDHIYPERLGGGLELSNLQTLCRTCNSRKGIRTS